MPLTCNIFSNTFCKSNHRREKTMPIINYSQLEKEDEHLTPSVIEMLLSNEYRPLQETMLYASKGKAKSVRFLNPKDLELLAVAFYKRLPYKKVRYSGQHASSDGGVDVWLTKHDADIEIVQCKQLSAKVTREQIKEFTKTMRKVGAIKGYYWAPGGFSKPAMDYANSTNESITLYDETFITKEVYEFFRDEVQLARDKLKNEIQDRPPTSGEEEKRKTSTKDIRHITNFSTPQIIAKNKPKRGWTVAQATIIFGMMILACLSIYYLLITITAR